MRSSSCLSLIATALALGACAQGARELPPDLSALPPAQRLVAGDINSIEYGLPCPSLHEVQVDLRKAIDAIHAKLAATQADNQSKGVAAVLLFTPIAAGMDNQTETRAELQAQEIRQERVLRIKQARGC